MYNNEFQVIDSQEKAYILGLMYADGCVTSTHRKSGGIIYSSSITLDNKDLKLLQSIREVIPSFKEYSFNNGRSTEIKSHYKECYNDLVNKGCLPRKSYENRFSLHIPSIDYSLIRHFIRGYFDGDGGCTLSYSNGKTQKRVYIYSVSPQLLAEFKNYLENLGVECTMDNGHNKGILCYKLSIRTNSYQKFYSFLYNDAHLKMERKYLKFTEILNTKFFTPKETTPCKFCGSIHTVCDGYDTYKFVRQRYLCKDCNKHFSASVRSNSNS